MDGKKEATYEREEEILAKYPNLLNQVSLILRTNYLSGGGCSDSNLISNFLVASLRAS